ncbi:YfhE family protein [Salipaludibacillus neizhouensis]|uniref:YfhE family protein n=1 Tax=Salipaludibacillus neizhouensis TaxID=885475 RepID=A0A3A9K919_9BACI|nr:YfhE family protein [Salipaludibacillus neizhouensis]RKL66143.1 YfhE family protein [Salipaludibacillus neizhouensis]
MTRKTSKTKEDRRTLSSAQEVSYQSSFKKADKEFFKSKSNL